MSKKLWRAMWKHNDIPFHQDSVTPLLSRHLARLRLPAASRVLVPLCGKTLDIGMFAEHGHHVIGVELSPIAIRDYFDALGVNPSRERVGHFTRWRHGKTELWCGDIFDLTRKDLLQQTLIYDCASLTALPTEERPAYVRFFRDCMPFGARILMATTESHDTLQGDSAQRIDVEITTLYTHDYHIELVQGRSLRRADPQAPLAPHTLMDEKLYLMSRR